MILPASKLTEFTPFGDYIDNKKGRLYMAIQGSSGNNYDNTATRAQHAKPLTPQQQEASKEPVSDPVSSEQSARSLAYDVEPQTGNTLVSQLFAQSSGPVNVTQSENEHGGVSVTVGVDADGNGVNGAEATEVYDAQGDLLPVKSSQDADQDGNTELADGFVFDAAGNISSYTVMLDEDDDGNVDYMYEEHDTTWNGGLDTFTESLFDENGEVIWRSSTGEGASMAPGTEPPANVPSAGGTSGSAATGSFISEHAGYSNAVYTYDLDDSGQPTNIRPVIDNTNAMAPGSELGDISTTNGRPNLLVLANGADAVDENSELSIVDGKLTIDGQVHDGPSYFSHDPSMSTDGENHFRFTTGSDGVTRVEIEDLLGLGDRDFNDLVLDVNTNTSVTGSFDSESAGYSNALYTYDLDADGNPTNLRQVIDNTNDPSLLGTDLNDISVNEGRPNLLLLPNGANKLAENTALSFENGQLMIGDEAYNGDYYFSHDAALGTDGMDHFQYEKAEDGSTRVMIEDLRGLGDNDFNDLQITVNSPNVQGPPQPPSERPSQPPAPPAGGTPPVDRQPPARDDGTDVYVIDSLGDHGMDVASVAQSAAGQGVDVALSGLPGIIDADIPETRAESSAVVNENVALLKGSLETVFVNQLGAGASKQDPGVQSILVGLDEAMDNFEDGTESFSDYLMIEESLTLLQFTDPLAADAFQYQLTSATTYHLNNFSDSPDVQDFINGNLTLTPESRLAFGAEHTGYKDVTATLESFAQQYHALDVSDLGDIYGQIAALTVGGITSDLKGGLGLAGLVDAQGNPVPVPGFGANEQPVRVANVSAGVSVANIVAGSAEARLLNLFPPPGDSLLGQSIASTNPGGQPISIEAAIANSALQQMNDPTTAAGLIYAENVAAQEAYVKSLLDANIIIVAAAGNSGGSIPGADSAVSRNLLVSDSMISVGASNAQGTADDLTDDTLAGFSSFGADFVAEGENLQHDVDILNGTSFSAPHVSGLIARIAEQYPDLSADQILSVIFDPANRDVLFEDIEGTIQDGLGIIRDDALDQVFANSIPTKL